MLIRFLGHACFQLTRSDGLRVVIDPYESGGFNGRVGYDPVDVEADVVVVTHEHLDHSHVAAVGGSFDVVREACTRRGVRFDTVRAFHDAERGNLRGGEVNLFCFTLDGVRVCHASDLGEVLNAEQVSALSSVDVLLIPTGGFYTLGPEDAFTVARAIGSRVVIPMHYKTSCCGFDIEPVEPFVDLFSEVHPCEHGTLELWSDRLPEEQTVYILQPERLMSGHPNNTRHL